MEVERKILDYYSGKAVQDAILRASFGREIAGVFPEGGYSSRPDIIKSPQDIIGMVKRGIVEFHSSIERWSNPMSIKPDNYNEIRTGWDIILDLDCEDTEHGKEAAKALLWALNEHGIKNISIKFTGGTGFHMGLPWESFPKEINFEPIVQKFPEIARIIANYLREFAKDKLIQNLEKRWSWDEMAESAGIKPEELVSNDGSINPWKIVDIDPVLISSRHLFRMPYSLNKKSFLASIPFDINDIDRFEKSWAEPHNVKAHMEFLDKWEENEAEKLFFEALKWHEKNREEEKKKAVINEIEITSKIPEEYFPPCIKNILKGMQDGKKRSMFILTSFLRSVKWEWPDIEARLFQWNELNSPQIPRSTIMNHVRNHKRKPDVLPPNCEGEGWYMDFGVCEPSECKKYKNPASFTIKNYAEKISKKKKRKPRKKKEEVIDNSILPKDAFR